MALIMFILIECVLGMDSIMTNFTKIGRRLPPPLLAEFYLQMPEIYVIDEMSFINLLPDEHKENYLRMLEDSVLLHERFRAFLQLCYFPKALKEPDIDTLVHSISTETSKDLCAKGGAVENAILQITQGNAKLTEDMLERVRPSILNIVSTFFSKTIPLLNKNPFCQTEIEQFYATIRDAFSQFKLDETICSSLRLKLTEIQHALIINRDEEYVQRIVDTVESSVSNPVYRKILVAFLASVERHHGLRILFRVTDENKFGVNFFPEMNVLSICLRNSIEDGFGNGGTFSLTLPYLFTEPHAVVGKLCKNFTNTYNYAHIHEFGHAIFLLIAPNLSKLKNLDMTHWEQISFAKTLLFPDFDNLNSDASLPPQLRSLFSYNLWDDVKEILQIAGIYFFDNKIIINKLSDLDLAVSIGNPISWTHHGVQDEKILYPKCNFVPDENTLKILFDLHGLNYEDYKQQVLKQTDFIDQ
ncbi:MAG: hypothetical protein LBJ77_03505 [Holosporales bacterium]|jgi:hypothetical protein|nr:hypothetical protein [Holosporales bacterium]